MDVHSSKTYSFNILQSKCHFFIFMKVCLNSRSFNFSPSVNTLRLILFNVWRGLFVYAIVLFGIIQIGMLS